MELSSAAALISSVASPPRLAHKIFGQDALFWLGRCALRTDPRLFQIPAVAGFLSLRCRSLDRSATNTLSQHLTLSTKLEYTFYVRSYALQSGQGRIDLYAQRIIKWQQAICHCVIMLYFRHIASDGCILA